MDRYMNDTHSLYYNVDHSSMFGSNLSTVFADGPPPLEDGDDDHGEFVFSSETDAIGEAVLNKIESKLQRDAEGRLDEKKSGFNSDVEVKPESSTEKFEAFANFETVNQIDTLGKQDASLGGSQEVNGYNGNLTNNITIDDDFSDDEFGDFSTGFGQNVNENGNSDIEKHDGNFGNFSAFNNGHESNEKSVFSHNEQPSFNGTGEGDTKTGSNSNDFQFANFSSFEDADYERNDGNGKSSEDSQVKQHFGKEPVMEGMDSDNEVSDDEFASFAEANEDTFAKFENNELNGSGSLTNPTPDVIPANDQNHLTSGKLPLDLTNHKMRKNDEFSSFDSFKDDTSANKRNELSSAELPHDLTSHETKHNNDEFNSFEAFKDDIPSNTSNDLTSVKSDLTNRETKSTDNLNSFQAFEDDSFNDFTSSSNFVNFPQDVPNVKNETKSESQSNNSESQAKEGNVIASSESDDFGDFADFSDTSFNAFSSDSGIASEMQSDAGFSQQNDASSTQWSESRFGAFTEHDKANKTQDTKILSRNNSSQDSGEFAAFAESTKNEPEFQADFGAFSESTRSKNKHGFQADFGAFSQNTVMRKSFDRTLSNKQHAIQTKLVSLHACFQDVFVTLQNNVDDLQHVKVPGNKRIGQENLWKNLQSNMGEAALRFTWEQCKASDQVCKALKVSKKNIGVNPNILAMGEGLGIPVFATGLGILQPSIVPTPPKIKKTKSKQPKATVTTVPSGSTSLTPPPNPPRQTAFPEFKTESIKDNNSDTASLSNSDTASLDLDFFASAPTNLPANSDQSSSSSLYNLDFAFGLAPPANQVSLVNSQSKASSSIQDDPLDILKKLDTSKMSSSVMHGSETQLSSRAKEIIETFDDLSFMHSSVLMFPLHKNN